MAHTRSTASAGLDLARSTALVCCAMALSACGACGDSKLAATVARFEGGVVTADELRREAQKLPPALRARFDSEAGERELAGAIIDRRLLAMEARERKLDEDPDVVRQVRDLEERLVIQALLAAEERAAGTAGEAEARAWYQAHQGELTQPERVRVSRVLATVPAAATKTDRDRARERAQRFAQRLRAGEDFARVAASGEGPEATRGGDVGLLTLADERDPRLVRAAFALTTPGDLSPVVETRDGYAVLRLEERRPARVPTFEEARGEIANRMAPERKRKVFDELLARLRAEANVQLGLAAPAR